jgi:hypothetical protein
MFKKLFHILQFYLSSDEFYPTLLILITHIKVDIAPCPLFDAVSTPQSFAPTHQQQPNFDLNHRIIASTTLIVFKVTRSELLTKGHPGSKAYILHLQTSNIDIIHYINLSL